MKNPLVQINKAEQALATASDIIDILELRTKSKAVQVVALAEGFADVAQSAKIFQLRAERKAGLWLGENIRPGKPSHDGRVTLADLELSNNASSRWQLMSTVPEERFDSWVDDKLARGYEITAGGLREYARNIKGLPAAKRRNTCPKCGYSWEA